MNLEQYKIVAQQMAEHRADIDHAIAEEKRKHQFDSALSVQVAGDHYKKLAIQPVEYIHANKLGFVEGSVIKYVTRWRDKGGIRDLEKARHFIDLLIELEGKNT